MRLIVVATCVLIFVVLAPALRGAPLGQSGNLLVEGALAGPGCPGARKGLVYYRARANEFRAMRDARPYPVGRAHRSPSCAFVRWAADLWRERAVAARREFVAWFGRMLGPDGRSGKWGCIHSREAAWNDQHPPHYGGLQFDDDFQRTYGSGFYARWGDAGNWPVWAQLIAAERAYVRRGFQPWPNTRRMCGV